MSFKKIYYYNFYTSKKLIKQTNCTLYVKPIGVVLLNRVHLELSIQCHFTADSNSKTTNTRDR